jgi:hypothetical protein
MDFRNLGNGLNSDTEPISHDPDEPSGNLLDGVI